MPVLVPNADGIRDSKTVNGTKHSYLTLDGVIYRETWGDNTLIFGQLPLAAHSCYGSGVRGRLNSVSGRSNPLLKNFEEIVLHFWLRIVFIYRSSS